MRVQVKEQLRDGIARGGEYWRSLSLREQVAIGIASVLVGFFLMYSVVAPIGEAFDIQHRRLKQLEGDLSGLQFMLTRYSQLRERLRSVEEK